MPVYLVNPKQILEQVVEQVEEEPVRKSRGRSKNMDCIGLCETDKQKAVLKKVCNY